MTNFSLFSCVRRIPLGYLKSGNSMSIKVRNSNEKVFFRGARTVCVLRAENRGGGSDTYFGKVNFFEQAIVFSNKKYIFF